MADIIEMLTIEQLADIIRSSGYRVVVEEGKNNKGEITFSSNGLNCRAFYSETELKQTGGITHITVYAIVNNEKIIDAYELNEFNNRLGAGRCYTGKEGHIFYDQRINISGGVTRQYLVNAFSRWDKGLGECLRFVGFAQLKAIELQRKMDEISKSGPRAPSKEKE